MKMLQKHMTAIVLATIGGGFSVSLSHAADSHENAPVVSDSAPMSGAEENDSEAPVNPQLDFESLKKLKLKDFSGTVRVVLKKPIIFKPNQLRVNLPGGCMFERLRESGIDGTGQRTIVVIPKGTSIDFEGPSGNSDWILPFATLYRPADVKPEERVSLGCVNMNLKHIVDYNKENFDIEFIPTYSVLGSGTAPSSRRPSGTSSPSVKP